MMDSKYIVFDSPGVGEFPVVFPQSVKHVMIAECVKAKYPGIKPIRAGFVRLNGEGVFHCYGSSQSLKLGGGGIADENLLNIMLGKDE